MRYLNTVNLWDNATHTAIISGQLKLLSGQWVQCGPGNRSRFVGVHNGVINAVHWSGTGARTNKVYLYRAHIARLQRQLDAGLIDNVVFRSKAIML